MQCYANSRKQTLDAKHMDETRDEVLRTKKKNKNPAEQLHGLSLTSSQDWLRGNYSSRAYYQIEVATRPYGLEIMHPAPTSGHSLADNQTRAI